MAMSRALAAPLPTSWVTKWDFFSRAEVSADRASASLMTPSCTRRWGRPLSNPRPEVVMAKETFSLMYLGQPRQSWKAEV